MKLWSLCSDVNFLSVFIDLFTWLYIELKRKMNEIYDKKKDFFSEIYDGWKRVDNVSNANYAQKNKPE